MIRDAIQDKNLKVPPGARVGLDRDLDANRFDVSPKGIVAVAKGTGVAPG